MIQVDTIKRRVTVRLPLAVHDLCEEGEIMSMIREVCGPDAVVATRVSNFLGSICACRPGDAEVWLSEVEPRA